MPSPGLAPSPAVIWILRGLSSSRLSRVTVRRPSLRAALTEFSLTAVGSTKLRSKRLQRRSTWRGCFASAAFFLFFLTFGADAQDALFEGDVDVFLAKAGHFGFDVEVVGIFVNVNGVGGEGGGHSALPQKRLSMRLNSRSSMSMGPSCGVVLRANMVFSLC